MRKIAATYAMESLGLSERKACRLTGISPSVYRYRSKRGDDGRLRLRMREIAGDEEALRKPEVAHDVEERGPGGLSQTYGAHLQ